jgi:hypothetical protein
MKSQEEVKQAAETIATVRAISMNGIYTSTIMTDRLKAIEEALTWVYYEWPGEPVHKENAHSIVADRAAHTIEGCRLLLKGMGRE